MKPPIRSSKLMLLNPAQKRYSASWASNMLKKSKNSMMESPLPWWLFGTAGLVATTLTVGAAARLTRSGGSTLYWKPHFLHPKTKTEWHDEFDVYCDFCVRCQRIPMTLEEFKRNYKWESAHRTLGQLTALSFVGPLAYFAMKRKLPISAQAPLALIAGLGATQLYIGREMVSSNVKPRRKNGGRDHEPMFEGATFFLPVHSALSLANFSLLIWTGLEIVSPVSRAITVRGFMTPGVLKEMGEIRKHFVALTGLVASTIFAGSLVAEIDGGREFQTFPKMGSRWIPHGLFEQKPWLRNFHDNVALVQLDHRLLALTTLAAYTTVFFKVRKPGIWTNLPEDAKRAIMLAFAATGGQVFMGATMLVNEVPTPLAMVHQGGATLVLGSSLWVLHSLRFARPSGLLGVAVATAASKVT
ncbi:cytochrome oxidase assembly [Phytophthora cinnamomi]|uniref:cytochrome oxidase assembly n=1 Tax=Phytophthora cinnamomi TaxID=4785 RepID=UPI00355A9EAF|nr:cytochrome oxidase assembly [Phytophthora cinnamomi]